MMMMMMMMITGAYRHHIHKIVTYDHVDDADKTNLNLQKPLKSQHLAKLNNPSHLRRRNTSRQRALNTLSVVSALFRLMSSFSL